MEFVIRTNKSATRRFFGYAEKTYRTQTLPGSSARPNIRRGVLIDGPCSKIRLLRQFDSVLLVAGSTSATFTVPLMRDTVQQWKGVGSGGKFSLEPAPGVVIRYIKLL